jgi:hypothetical protein
METANTSFKVREGFVPGGKQAAARSIRNRESPAPTRFVQTNAQRCGKISARQTNSAQNHLAA